MLLKMKHIGVIKGKIIVIDVILKENNFFILKNNKKYQLDH